jgi:L-arabinose 1-dehydrogenase
MAQQGRGERSRQTIRIGIVGLGRIACDQHIPRIAANPAFALAGTASPRATAQGVPHFATFEDMLNSVDDLDAVAICTPPQIRFASATRALAAGKHVLLEKPPCGSVVELELLLEHARMVGRTLYAPWHSQYAQSVARAAQILRDRTLVSVRIVWQEDVRHWHPGQTWLTAPGGFGVFDAGINPISILTLLIPDALIARRAHLFIPANWSTPIAADLEWESAGGVPISARLDFDFRGAPRWEIEFVSDNTTLRLSDGGKVLTFADEPAPCPQASLDSEYTMIYRRFADLIRQGASEVDMRPLRYVEDLLRVATCDGVEAFVH